MYKRRVIKISQKFEQKEMCKSFPEKSNYIITDASLRSSIDNQILGKVKTCIAREIHHKLRWKCIAHWQYWPGVPFSMRGGCCFSFRRISMCFSVETTQHQDGLHDYNDVTSILRNCRRYIAANYSGISSSPRARSVYRLSQRKWN